MLFVFLLSDIRQHVLSLAYAICVSTKRHSAACAVASLCRLCFYKATFGSMCCRKPMLFSFLRSDIRQHVLSLAYAVCVSSERHSAACAVASLCRLCFF